VIKSAVPPGVLTDFTRFRSSYVRTVFWPAVTLPRSQLFVVSVVHSAVQATLPAAS
jgi:hypothetical protein